MSVRRLPRVGEGPVRMLIVPAVPAMHEDVKQRAGEDQQPRQPAKKVCPMFRDQVEGSEGEEAEKGDVGGR